MSKLPSIGGTLTGGIQDISALLPLLGTEQCERHVGSALDAGFLYSAVTPISIFGSLGIVRASFNILVASFNIQRYQFLGARLLSNSGFSPSGTVAPMIALDPTHPNRFLAETRLEAMLAEEHIDNVDNLTVSWGKGTVQWNFMLIAFSLVISSAGLLPYIIIILDPGDTNRKHLFPLGFGFPILRVFGSAVCVIVAQLLIQIRIVAIMKNRLLFISIDRLAKVNKIEDLASEISIGLQEENANNVWASALAAEKCLWALQKWLTASIDPERAENHQKMVDIYAAQYEQHFGPINFPIHPWMTLLLCFGLAIGCISTVVGYIGSFFLIQHSTSPNGPLVWLVLEAVLSVLRILLWAINPSWDDSKGIDFELQLSANPPVLTISKAAEDILDQSLVYLTRNNVNLEEAVAYAGPLPIFSVQDVELYYIFAINSQIDTSRRLLIVISIPKKQRSRILVKESVYSPFSIYMCTLQSYIGNTLTALRISATAHPSSHFLTSHSVFMAELEAHYDKINFELQNQGSTEERRAISGKTWTMQQPLTDTTNYNQHSKMEKTGPPLLTTDGEKAYLSQYLVEWRRVGSSLEVERCISTRINIYSKQLGLTRDTMLPPVGMNELISFLWQHEVFEKTCLLIECQLYFERSLRCISAKWDKDIRKSHANMVEILLKAPLEKATKSAPIVSSISKRHGNNTRNHKLEVRLSVGLEQYLHSEAEAESDHLRDRLNEHLTPLVYEGATVEHQPELGHRMSRIQEVLLNTAVDYQTWDVNLADLFKLPSDLAASFNAALPSEQSSMLIQIQKHNFVREMEDRFRDYPRRNKRRRFLSIDDDSGEESLDLDDEVRGSIDQFRARCRARAEKLFEMLASSETADFKQIIDSPPFNIADEPSDPTHIIRIVDDVSEQWKRKVDQSEEELAGMEKRVIQTKISEYFVKKLK